MDNQLTARIFDGEFKYFTYVRYIFCRNVWRLSTVSNVIIRLFEERTELYNRLKTS